MSYYLYYYFVYFIES